MTNRQAAPQAAYNNTPIGGQQDDNLERIGFEILLPVAM
jgi:hypothetical protein